MKEPYQMAEILRKQYESAFSTPNPELNIDNIGDKFFLNESNSEEREEGEARDEGREEEQEEEEEERAG